MLIVEVNILLVIGLTLFGIAIGFKLRRSRLTSLKARVEELERELHANYSDLLELKK
jgi:hypothetical protein